MQYRLFVKNELIIVRYGELGLKAAETRRRFENSLVNNIKNALKTKKIFFELKKEWGRIYVFTDQINESIDVLQKIFGITSISPAIKTNSKIKDISKVAVYISKENLTKKKSFALRVERTGDHSFTSQNVAVQIGNYIVKATKSGVDLTNPDFELFIEIRDKNAYLFTKKIRCTGGLPLRTQGKILVFVDNLDSILAAWYIMHRGCSTVFLISNKSLNNILKKFIDTWHTNHDVVVFDNKKAIYEDINDVASKKKCVALVTGHSFYSPTKDVVSDLKLLNAQINIPVLHPLIAMEKDEINKKLQEIGIKP